MKPLCTQLAQETGETAMETIAETIGGDVKPRQVHKILQNYRHERRKNYEVE